MHPHGIWFDVQFSICSCFTFCFLWVFDFQYAFHLDMWRMGDILYTVLGACFDAWFHAHPLELGRAWEQTFILCYIYILIGYLRTILIFKRPLSPKLKFEMWILLRFRVQFIRRWLLAQDLGSIRRFSTFRKTLDAFEFINTLSFWLLNYRLSSLQNQWELFFRRVLQIFGFDFFWLLTWVSGQVLVPYEAVDRSKPLRWNKLCPCVLAWMLAGVEQLLIRWITLQRVLYFIIWASKFRVCK